VTVRALRPPCHAAQSVPDLTGREDLVAHLRTHRLLAAGRELGCGKVARGDCATRLAAHIMAAASKGCGYGLPGDVQLVDARCEGGARLFVECGERGWPLRVACVPGRGRVLTVRVGWVAPGGSRGQSGVWRGTPSMQPEIGKWRGL
jgi:hypothetical protein